ncbi:MAG TPA: polysaccharide pyruvyl transferase family protein [Methylomirabilota bacterium]|nr:polysaccharide pyruvyl transferase family protein [Methylomirabilota bacterium]
MNRRTFLQSTVAAALAAAIQGAVPARRPCILLRSSWQVVNIGDIAHTPGVLALLEKHIPEAEVILWASSDLSPEVAAMEHRRFPKLRIVKGSIREDGTVTDKALEEAIQEADFLLHGSGPSLVAAKDVAAFMKLTGKPFGVYGITHGSFFTSRTDKDLLSKAKFVFFRDSVSLAHARKEGVTAPVMEFGPDGAFACDLRNDAAAEQFLKASKLQEGKFVCCIPRLRYTPYWEMRGEAMTAEQRRRHARNEAMAEHDHAPLREAIRAIVKETDFRVLLCPEDKSQMAVGKRWILEKLAPSERQRVVWREEFWLTDEALSTYVRSAGLFGLEMHSPIMCIGNGVPAIVCRFEEQTSKGIMWRDIGLGDWLFDFDREEDIQRFTPTVLEMLSNRAGALAKVNQAQQFVQQRQRETMAHVSKSVAENQS